MNTKGKNNNLMLGLVIVLSIFSTIALSKVFLMLVNADAVTTAVTVGNSAPSITAGPAESPESSSTTPTDVGSNTTWTATATDSNSEDYYLIICSSDSATPTNGGEPNCGATEYCTSTSTDSGVQATCSRTALVGDAQSNVWYAFVCDGNATDAECSATGAQGSGGTGSPFNVNHVPGFTAASNNGPKDPGVDVTWSTTSSDSDNEGTPDTVKLLVCKTTGISGGACDGGGSDTWCSSSLVASNPTCAFSIPAVYPDDTYNAYTYIVDNHNFGASSAYQGGNVTFAVNNIAPVVSATTINGGSAISLTEGTTTNVVITATVSDNNSCYGSELTTIYAYAYRTGIAYSGCDTSGEANNNYCYPEVSCSVVGGTCTDNTDASANYTCTSSIQYYADPTDDNTEFPTEYWKSTVKAIDDDTASHTYEVGTGVKMNSTTALDVTGSINYGNLDVNGKNDPLDKTTTVTPTGNVGLDSEQSGVQMCVDYPTCSGGTPITVGYQHYALAGSTAYASGFVLSGTPTEKELNVPKAESGSPTTKDIWWGIQIPTGTVPGAYSGSNTVGAVKGETANW